MGIKGASLKVDYPYRSILYILPGTLGLQMITWVTDMHRCVSLKNKRRQLGQLLNFYFGFD